jgi:hypothetical protein
MPSGCWRQSEPRPGGLIPSMAMPSWRLRTDDSQSPRASRSRERRHKAPMASKMRLTRATPRQG